MKNKQLMYSFNSQFIDNVLFTKYYFI